MNTRQRLVLRTGIYLYRGPVEEIEYLDVLNGYEEIGIEEFKDVVKYLYIYSNQFEDKQDFDMEVALRLYEGGSGL